MARSITIVVGFSEPSRRERIRRALHLDRCPYCGKITPRDPRGHVEREHPLP